jgi:hypothetical protein
MFATLLFLSQRANNPENRILKVLMLIVFKVTGWIQAFFDTKFVYISLNDSNLKLAQSSDSVLW